MEFPGNVISTPLLSIHLPMSVWLEAEWQYTVPSWWVEFASRAVLLGIVLIRLLSPTPVYGVWGMGYGVCKEWSMGYGVSVCVLMPFNSTMAMHIIPGIGMAECITGITRGTFHGNGGNGTGH